MDAVHKWLDDEHVDVLNVKEQFTVWEKLGQIPTAIEEEKVLYKRVRCARFAAFANTIYSRRIILCLFFHLQCEVNCSFVCFRSLCALAPRLFFFSFALKMFTFLLFSLGLGQRIFAYFPCGGDSDLSVHLGVS